MMKAAGSPASSPGVKTSFRSSKLGSGSKNQASNLLNNAEPQPTRNSVAASQKTHEQSPLKKSSSTMGQARKSALPMTTTSPQL